MSAGEHRLRPWSRGLSVLELVVALAIFSVAALLGAEVLYSTLSFDRQLDARQSRTQEAALTLTLARRDLRNAVSFETSPTDENIVEFRLQTAGLALDGETINTRAGEVIWRWSRDAQTLRRGIVGLDGRLVSTQLLDGVEKLDLQTTDQVDESWLISLRLTVSDLGDLVVTETAP